jgi:hypothetical protein
VRSVEEEASDIQHLDDECSGVFEHNNRLVQSKRAHHLLVLSQIAGRYAIVIHVVNIGSAQGTCKLRQCHTT